MNAMPHDASPNTDREPAAGWTEEPPSPEPDPDRQPVGLDEPPIEEPGYGHGV